MKIQVGKYKLVITVKLTSYPDWYYQMIDEIKVGSTLTAAKIYKDNTGENLTKTMSYIKKVKNHFDEKGTIKTDFN